MTDLTHSVRIKTGDWTWTTPPLTIDAARQLRDQLRQEIRAAGDGPALVDVVNRDGREVSLRARDVESIDWGRIPTRVEPQQQASLPDLSVGALRAGTGTDFLRRQAGISPEDFADSVVKP